MRVLVTGANGFLGARVVEALARRGHQVRGLVRSGSSGAIEASCALGVSRADLRTGPDLAALFDGIDVLVHLAAAVRGSADQQFSSTVVGTERLLDAMATTGTRALVLASSFSVYDWSKPTRDFTEDHPIDDRWAERDGYAIAKIWQERLARRFAAKAGWSLVVLRPGFIWGKPGEFISGIGQEVGRRHYVVVGPSSRMPLTFVDNCAAAFAQAAERAHAGQSATVNIVDEQDVSSWRFAKLTGGEGKRGIPVPYAVARVAVAAIGAVSRMVFGKDAKLPSILVSRRFEARFKPISCNRSRLAQALPDYRPEGLQASLDRLAAGTANPSRT